MAGAMAARMKNLRSKVGQVGGFFETHAGDTPGVGTELGSVVRMPSTSVQISMRAALRAEPTMEAVKSEPPRPSVVGIPSRVAPIKPPSTGILPSASSGNKRGLQSGSVSSQRGVAWVCAASVTMQRLEHPPTQRANQPLKGRRNDAAGKTFSETEQVILQARAKQSGGGDAGKAGFALAGSQEQGDSAEIGVALHRKARRRPVHVDVASSPSHRGGRLQVAAGSRFPRLQQSSVTSAECADHNHGLLVQPLPNDLHHDDEWHWRPPPKCRQTS